MVKGHLGRGQRSLGSRSKVTWVKVKGQYKTMAKKMASRSYTPVQAGLATNRIH